MTLFCTKLTQLPLSCPLLFVRCLLLLHVFLARVLLEIDSRAFRFDGMEGGEEATPKPSPVLEPRGCDAVGKQVGVDKSDDEMMAGDWLFRPRVWAASALEVGVFPERYEFQIILKRACP